MKDSISSIRKRGKSSILRELADRIDYEASSDSSPSPNSELVSEIHNGDELKTLTVNMEVIIIVSHCCNESNVVDLDLSCFSNLRKLIVGDECLKNVQEVKLIGLSELETVVVGENSFTKAKCDRNRHFYLRNCERLRKLKIGSGSFNDFFVCEIDNTPSLEVIEMGQLNDDRSTFSCGSQLELKSGYDGMK